jgi:OPT family oligopeptide transporter
MNAILYDGKTLISRLRRNQKDEAEDPHMRMMKAYPEVPEWWFQILLGLLLVGTVVTVAAWPTFLPWWGLLITFLIPVVFTLPIGMIQARTSQQIGLNVITEFVAGYIWPGRPVANVLVKIYGYITMSKALLFISDLKLGIYMKIPPRAMFRFQIMGCMISNFSALGSIHLNPLIP